jgi:hypothetical protein
MADNSYTINLAKGYECSACAQNAILPKDVLINDAKELVMKFISSDFIFMLINDYLI